MELDNHFKHVFAISSEISTLSLPSCKQNLLKVQFEDSETSESVYSVSKPILPFSNSDIFHAPIESSKRLTASQGPYKSVYEISLNVKDSGFKFKAGDTIGVIPHNRRAEVDTIIHHLGLAKVANLSYQLSIDSSLKNAKIPPHIPINSNIKYVLTHCLDIRTVLKKLFLLELSMHTKDKSEKKVLQYLCSKEGSETYISHLVNKNVTLIDILKIFRTCKPPIEVLFAHLPRLLPRPYSIVNSGMKHSNVLKICFSVKEQQKGLTTGWMEELIVTDNIENDLQNLSLENKIKSIPIYLRKNMFEFCLPINLEDPIIMIGVGTGLSPFIGFLEERDYYKDQNSKLCLGNAWLFFGCRDLKFDYIYEDQLTKFLEDGVLNRLSTAYSRIDSEFKYVQDAILKNGKDVVELIQDDARVYICGDINTIAPQIKETIVQCLIEHDNKTKEESEKYVMDMIKTKKYIVDIWN